MNSAARSVVCLALLSLCSPLIHAESKTDALRTSLLQSVGRFHLGDANAAWHMTASVKLFHEGEPSETGALEFFHGANGNTRAMYVFPDFHQAVTKTAQGRFQEGDEGEAPGGLTEFLHFLQKPADMTVLQTAKLGTFIHKWNGVDLRCIHTRSDTGQAPLNKELFCNIAGSPVIRYASMPSFQSAYQTLFVKMNKFQGGDVPDSAILFFDGIPIARLELTFTPLSSEDIAQLQPAADAVQINSSPSRRLAHELDYGLMQADFLPVPDVPGPGTDVPLASILLRLQIDANGKIVDVKTVAAINARITRHFVSSLTGMQIKGGRASASRFVNFSVIRAPHVDTAWIDTFTDIGPNPG